MNNHYDPNQPRNAEGEWTDAGGAIKKAASDKKNELIILDDTPLKNNEDYFLRYTDNAELDLKRGTSLNLTDFDSIKEAKKAYPDSNFVKLKNGTVGEVINGLSSYQLDSRDLMETIDEADSLIEYNIKHSGASGNNDITEKRVPVLFKGVYSENDNTADGDTMKPKSIVAYLKIPK